MEVGESGNSCLVPLVLNFVLSPHIPGDPQDLRH